MLIPGSFPSSGNNNQLPPSSQSIAFAGCFRSHLDIHKPIDFTRDHLEPVLAAVAEWELLGVHRTEVASLARPGDLVLVILLNEE
jgi:hypothetical protein